MSRPQVSLWADNGANRSFYLLTLSNLRSWVVFSGCLWNKLSIFGLFSLSETESAYSSRLTRFIMFRYYIRIQMLVKQKQESLSFPVFRL